MAYKKIQFKRGSKAGMPVLRSGEPGFTQDEKSLYIGDGTSNQRFLNEVQIGTKIDEKIVPVTQSITDNVVALNQTINTKEQTLDAKITDKTKINNIPQNVNFIRNEITKNGLVDVIVGNPSLTPSNTTKDISSTSVIDVNFYFTAKDNSGTYTDHQIIKLTGTTGARSYISVLRTNMQTLQFFDGQTVELKESILNKKIRFRYVDDGTTAYLYMDGKLLLSGKSNFAYTQVILTTSRNVYEDILIYNRILTPREIQHNFSVLNNTYSINRISDYAISTDTDHVQDRTGRVQDTINRVFYKNMCKEFTSSGEAISVNNGMDGYVLSGKIEGQTVKNIITAKQIKPFNMDGVLTPYMGFNTYFGVDGFSVQPSGTYTIFMDVTRFVKNTGQLRIACLNNLGETVFLSQLISPTALGMYKLTFTTPSNVVAIKGLSSNSANSNYDYQVDNLMIVEGDGSGIKGFFTGLSSTKATITNNGLKYSFYMPTIDGKTKVMKSLKGANSWVEIDASEARDTAKYDYKLENTTSDLGSTPSVSDYIDRARKVKVVNTKEIVFNGNQSVYTYKQSTNKDYSYFRVIYDNNYVPVNVSLGISTYSYAGPDMYGMYYNTCTTCAIWITGDGFYVSVPTSKLSDYSAGSFKTYLQTNPITLRYQLATPIEVPLTDAELSAYDAYRKVIDLGGLDGARNTLEIKEDVSGVYAQGTKEIVLNGNEGWAYANLSQTNVFTCYYGLGGIKSLNNIATINTKQDITQDTEGVTTHTNGNIYISVLRSKLTTQDVAGFKAWLQANPVTVRYQLATPIVTTIDKSLVPTILTQATNTFTFGDGVMATKATISAPVNRIAEMQKEIDEIKALIQTPSNINLTMNYIEDEYNKNQEVEGVM